MIKFKNNKKGFSLIEIIISIAILSILSIAFLTLFLFGFKNVINSGINSKNLYNAQSLVETNISDIESSSPYLKSGDPYTPIYLHKSGVIYTITGYEIIVPYTNGSSTQEVITFIGN